MADSTVGAQPAADRTHSLSLVRGSMEEKNKAAGGLAPRGAVFAGLRVERLVVLLSGSSGVIPVALGAKGNSVKIPIPGAGRDIDSWAYAQSDAPGNGRYCFSRWWLLEEELALFFIRRREPWNHLDRRKGRDIL